MGPSGHIGYIFHILDCLGHACFYGYCSMGPRGRFYPYLYHCDYIGLLGQVSCGCFNWVELPVQRRLCRFSKVASGNPTSTSIPRVDR